MTANRRISADCDGDDADARARTVAADPRRLKLASPRACSALAVAGWCEGRLSRHGRRARSRRRRTSVGAWPWPRQGLLAVPLPTEMRGGSLFIQPKKRRTKTPNKSENNTTKKKEKRKNQQTAGGKARARGHQRKNEKYTHVHTRIRARARTRSMQSKTHGTFPSQSGQSQEKDERSGADRER